MLMRVSRVSDEVMALVDSIDTDALQRLDDIRLKAENLREDQAKKYRREIKGYMQEIIAARPRISEALEEVRVLMSRIYRLAH